MASWIEKYWPLLVLGAGAGIGVAVYASKSSAAPSGPTAPGTTTPPAAPPVSTANPPAGTPAPVSAPAPAPPPLPPAIALVVPVDPTATVADSKLATLAQSAAKVLGSTPGSPLLYQTAARLITQAAFNSQLFQLEAGFQGYITDPHMIAAAQVALPLTHIGLPVVPATGIVDAATTAALKTFATTWDKQRKVLSASGKLDYVMWSSVIYAAYG